MACELIDVRDLNFIREYYIFNLEHALCAHMDFASAILYKCYFDMVAS